MNRKIIPIALGLLLTAQAAMAQTVKIQDDNFKHALITEGVDLNGDGEIQVSEAQKVTRLYVDRRHISSLVGIKSFTNLEEFGFYENQIWEVDLQGMSKLKSVYGFSTGLERLNIKGCVNLETLYVEYNKLREIDLSGKPKLRELRLQHNELSAADISGKPLLVECQMNNNHISVFNPAGSTAIKTLMLEANYFEALDLRQLKDLEVVDVYNNQQLTSLKVSGLRKLKELNASSCPLTNLNLSGTVSLSNFSW